VDVGEIDRNLARLRETVAVMSTNLVDLETDAGRTRLDQAPLGGTTQERWAEARGDLTYLWQWFTQLNDLLEKAVELRGTKPRLDPAPLTQLDWLVNGPSIELSTADIPLAERGLFGPAETTIRCTPPQLLERMRTAFDRVVGMISECSRRWSTLDARLLPLADQLAEARRLAEAVGELHRPELDRAQAQLDQLQRAVMSDPLAASADTAEAIAGTVGAATDDLRRLVQLRDNLAIRVGEARALMADLRATTAAAADARADALSKIANPSVIDPRPVADTVEAELARVSGMSAQGDWRAAGNLLVQWTTRCRDALDEAQRALAANQAPVATRNELRGRLDAYRAKAYRLGLLEDPAVAGLYARAQDALFTAPTDLEKAEQLLRRYQQALTGPASREVTT
jgi:hypothetical protein